MEAGLANQLGLLLGNSPAHPWENQAGQPQVDIQPALVVDILDTRLLQLAKVLAAKGLQDPPAAAASQLVAANCLLLPTAAARAEAALQAPDHLARPLAQTPYTSHPRPPLY